MISQIILTLLLQQTSAQLGDILSYKYQRYSECSSLLQTCQPTISTCADYVCAQCTDLGQTILNNCCSQAVPVQCFINGAGGSGSGGDGGNPYITTEAPDPNLTVCSTALSYITICEAQTPGFSNLANSDEASCLCYDSNTSWDPNAFDVPWSSCVAWAKTADTTAYADLLSNTGMCASVGNVLAAPASGVAASTTVGGSTSGSGGKATSTSAKATPVGGSGSGTSATATSQKATLVATTVSSSTSSAAKATSSSGSSSLVRNIRSGVVAQLILGFGLTLAL